MRRKCQYQIWQTESRRYNKQFNTCGGNVITEYLEPAECIY